MVVLPLESTRQKSIHKQIKTFIMARLNNRAFLPALAFMAALLIVLGTSAFNQKAALRPHETQDILEHFQFTGDTHTEEQFEIASNWQALGSSAPSSNPCPAGTVKTCVVKVDASLLPAPDPDLNTKEKRFAKLLQDMASASSFVNDGSNIIYKRN
jgi:hypothetical protein